jgi:hypothetical protein
MRVWHDGKVEAIVPLPGMVGELELSADGTHVLTSRERGSDSVRVWDVSEASARAVVRSLGVGK